MATAKQIAWRKKFAARYGGGRKTKTSKKTRSPSKGRTPMARRRKSVGAKARRTYRKMRRNRQNVIPVVDVLHGIYTLDGMTNGSTSRAASQMASALFVGGSAISVDKAMDTAVTGMKGALDDPKKAVLGGFKNFVVLWAGRKVLGMVGVPRSVRIFGKTRIQVR